MAENEYVMLSIRPETKARFMKLGTMSDTHDSLLVKLMEVFEAQKKD